MFPQLAAQAAAKDRIVAPAAVVAAAPDVILASWCGKKVVPARIAARPGWDAVPAARENRIVEIKSPLILQPGPATLTDGLDPIVAGLEGARAARVAGAGAGSGHRTWPLGERHRAVLLKVPDEGWVEGSRIDGRSLAVLLRRGWIRRVHLNPRGQPRRDGYQRTARRGPCSSRMGSLRPERRIG